MPLITQQDSERIDALLSAVDERVSREVRSDVIQPVHTVYLPADRMDAGVVGRWRDAALDSMGGVGGVAGLCEALEVPSQVRATVATAVERKLAVQPIEDLRIDFEDGYGDHGADEDGHALGAADAVAALLGEADAPSFIGIRFKCMEPDVRTRGLRTLDLFLERLAGHGPLPTGLRLTLPKVSHVDQVEAMTVVCDRLEDALGLASGTLTFEIQVELPQLIVGPAGEIPVAGAIRRGRGRVTGLHYGTYDYSAALGIAAAQQTLAHPGADFAKQFMQAAVVGTGVAVSDGSTNILPVGDVEARLAAWRNHHGLVRRSLENGIRQGWDMHPAHLVTRYIAVFSFYRQAMPAALARLAAYVGAADTGIVDEPATARALARTVTRALRCGAIVADEIADAGISAGVLQDLAR